MWHKTGKIRYIIYLTVLLVCWSCNTTKTVPDGQYLLDDFNIKADNKQIDVATLETYVRQKPNSNFPLLGKVRLGIYNTAGTDTTKWITRMLHKLGQPPVIYSARLTQVSASQIDKAVENMGYLNAEVDTIIQAKNKKAKVTYQIHSGIPYKIRNYEITIGDSTIARVLTRSQRFSQIKPGMLFDKEILEEERTNMNSLLRNVGYYEFSKEKLYYRADTTLNSHEVDLYLSLYKNPDSTGHKRYRLRNVTITSGYDPAQEGYSKRMFRNPDTLVKNNITLIHGRNNFLRNSTILRNNYLYPGRLYSDMAANRTYSAFNSIGAIKQITMNFSPVVSDTAYMLDATINLSPANVHWFQVGIDGTNSAGDIGLAPYTSYQHQNIFNGGEILSIRLKGAYEFVNGTSNTNIEGKNYYEYGIEVGLSFPQFLFPWVKKSWREIPSASTQILLGLNNQHRAEYTRQFFNATYTFRWNTLRNQLSHSFDFLDINYIRMPWVSDSFKAYYQGNPILKATYDNQLIARTGYAITYTRGNRSIRYPRNSFTIRGTVDLAGWLPEIARGVGNLKKNSNGQYQIFGIAYAEYIKSTISFSQTRNFNRTKSLAYNIALGVANPFGNSTVLPFEKRFFSGGANSLRGWSTRTLGPGSYQPNDSTTFANQVGDIKLDLNIEYRNKVTDLIELAAFIDAGNIWTIRNYEGQEGGLFKFSEFYKEIAASYGVGFRIDLSFLILRLDFGMKAYDPSRDEGDRFVIQRPKFSRDFAWHFAIGYPF